MSKNKLSCIVLALLVTLPSFAKKKVPLSGVWREQYKSIIVKLPIQVWVEDNNDSLLLEFSSYIGTVEVIVTNSTGNVIYKQSVDTNSTSSTIIALNEKVKQGDVIYITDGNNIASGNLSNY
ncbi:DUF3244 domain-containing protein [Parabacteroides acidifaciens]|nr:DUF3244 domain-containing protein [Parabacteroides acidifaciens]